MSTSLVLRKRRGMRADTKRPYGLYVRVATLCETGYDAVAYVDAETAGFLAAVRGIEYLGRSTTRPAPAAEIGELVVRWVPGRKKYSQVFDVTIESAAGRRVVTSCRQELAEEIVGTGTARWAGGRNPALLERYQTENKQRRISSMLRERAKEHRAAAA